MKYYKMKQCFKKIWQVSFIMCSKGYISGMVTGAIIGMAVAVIADPMRDKHHRQIRRKTNQLVRTVSDAIDNMMDK